MRSMNLNIVCDDNEEYAKKWKEKVVNLQQVEENVRTLRQTV